MYNWGVRRLIAPTVCCSAHELPVTVPFIRWTQPGKKRYPARDYAWNFSNLAWHQSTAKLHSDHRMICMSSPATSILRYALRRQNILQKSATAPFHGAAAMMNRPRNKQPRPPRDGSDAGRGRGQTRGRGGRGSSRGGGRQWTPGTPQQAAGTVPTLRQVVPGASVFIILKDDQSSGQETAGVVQDVLTSGNHPRGIKVRLQDGQVGRVQRLGGGGEPQPTPGAASSSAPSRPFSHKYTDVRQDEHLYPSEPPARSLADFMPAFADEPSQPPNTGPVVKCPFCDEFEGDEPAATHHIDEVHLGS